MKAFVTIVAFVAVVHGLPMAKEESIMDKFMANLRECVESDTVLCLKEKAMKYSENLVVSKDLSIADGVLTFSRIGSPRSARSYEPLPEDAKARQVAVEDRILENVVDFLDGHALTLRMPKSFIEDDDNSVDFEGRKKKKKKLKKLLPLIALIKLKLAALVPLFLGIIAFSLFKAVFLGKIAFLFSAFGIIKKLLESKKSSGWSEPPHEEHSSWENSGGGGGWGRSQEGHDLAYEAHAKQL